MSDIERRRNILQPNCLPDPTSSEYNTLCLRMQHLLAMRADPFIRRVIHFDNYFIVSLILTCQ